MKYNLVDSIFLTEVFNANHDSIVDIVRNKRVVAMYYKGDKENSPGWRTIEPVCYGSRKGVNYVRAWQQRGKTTTTQPAWKFFRIDRIKNWNLCSNKTNVKARSLFNPNGDKLLDKIYAISDYKIKKLDPKPTDSPSIQESKSLVKRLKTLEEIFEMY